MEQFWVNWVNENTMILCQKRENTLTGVKHTFNFSIWKCWTRLAFLDKSTIWNHDTVVIPEELVGALFVLWSVQSLKLYQKYTDFTLKTLFRVKLESLSTFRDFFFFLGSKVSWKIWIFPVLGVCLFESMAAVTLTYYWWVETYNLNFLQNHFLW